MHQLSHLPEHPSATLQVSPPPWPVAMKFYVRARNIQTNPEFDLDLRKTFEIYTVDRAN
jgi:hypothetical protein